MRTGANPFTDPAGGHTPVVDLRYTSPLVRVGHARGATGRTSQLPTPRPRTLCPRFAEHGSVSTNLGPMLDEEVTRLSEPYQGEVKPEEPGLLRVASPLGLNLATSVALGDEIVDDLDKAVHGSAGGKAYPDLDQQTRILLSDYLAACARAIPDNLVEAQVERLEHDHAADIGVAALPSNLVKADLDTALSPWPRRVQATKYSHKCRPPYNRRRPLPALPDGVIGSWECATLTFIAGAVASPVWKPRRQRGG